MSQCERVHIGAKKEIIWLEYFDKTHIIWDLGKVH